MNKFRFTINALAVATFVIALASMAQAQATRTWVSGVGDDANPCSRTAPCKTFAGAISKTAPFGEIDALDPGGFGALTITKSLTIDGGGGQVASILVAGTNGIVIQGANTDIITLCNLRFQGLRGSGSPGLAGIKINAAAGVIINNCVIRNFGGDGIQDARTNTGYLEVNNTIITNSQNGISVIPANGQQVNAHITNCRLQGNAASGLLAGNNAVAAGTVRAVLFDTIATQNVVAGVNVATTGSTMDVNVDHCVVASNVTGFQTSGANSTIRVSNTNAVVNGSLANNAGGGTISSYGNNQTSGLTFPSSGTGQQ